MEKNIEMLVNTQSYLNLLANGRDPVTGNDLPEDTVLNSVQLSRCFNTASGVLQKVIENGGEVRRFMKKQLPPFTITEEEKAGVELSDEPVQITKFCERINGQIDTEKLRKLKVTAFGKWLLDKGFLTLDVHKEQKYKKPTELGESIGLTSALRVYGNQEYYAMTYNKDAQQFLMDNLDEVIAISNGERIAQ